MREDPQPAATNMADMLLQIRTGRADDAAVLADFNRRMARETEGLELDDATVRRGVGAVLDDPAKGFYLVAVSGGAVVGQLMVTFEWSDWRDGNIWWVQSVYVLPEFRRRGVFAALYRHAQALARDQRVVGLRLYVEQDNDSAQRTYARLGMRLAHYKVMEQMFRPEAGD